MTASIVLSANFVTLAGMILASVTALGVAMISQGRRIREGQADVKKTVVDGYLDTTKRSDAVKTTLDATHDQVRTTNGHTVGELVEVLARDVAQHLVDDDLRASVLFAHAGIPDPVNPKGP